jgi:hypothetical protein
VHAINCPHLISHIAYSESTYGLKLHLNQLSTASQVLSGLAFKAGYTLCYLLPALLLKLPVIRNYGSQGLCLDLLPSSSALHALCLALRNLTCYVQRFPSSKVICSVCLPPHAAFVWRPEWNSISPANVGRVQSRYSTRVIFAAAFHRKLFLVRQLMLRLRAPVISSSIFVLTVTTSLHPYLPSRDVVSLASCVIAI